MDKRGRPTSGYENRWCMADEEVQPPSHLGPQERSRVEQQGAGHLYEQGVQIR